jgi:hypothetical protein
MWKNRWPSTINVIDERRPATSTDLVALVDALPGELDTGLAVAFSRAVVQPAADGDERELAGPVPGELDEPGSTRLMASWSHSLISTIRHRAINGAADPTRSYGGRAQAASCGRSSCWAR